MQDNFRINLQMVYVSNSVATSFSHGWLLKSLRLTKITFEHFISILKYRKRCAYCQNINRKFTSRGLCVPIHSHSRSFEKLNGLSFCPFLEAVKGIQVLLISKVFKNNLFAHYSPIKLLIQRSQTMFACNAFKTKLEMKWGIGWF